MPRAEGQSNVPMEDFITAVQTSKSHKEVANKLGLSVQSVATRITNYRKGKKNEDGSWARKPINLKQFARGSSGPRLDVDAANALIEAINAAANEE